MLIVVVVYFSFHFLIFQNMAAAAVAESDANILEFVDSLMNMKEAPEGFEWLWAKLQKEPDAAKRIQLATDEQEFNNLCLKASAIDDDYDKTKTLLSQPDAMARVGKMKHPFWGGTLLHTAASNGCQRSIFALLEAKFDPQTKCNFGKTAIECARPSGNDLTIAILRGRITEMPASKFFLLCCMCLVMLSLGTREQDLEYARKVSAAAREQDLEDATAAFRGSDEE